MRRSWIAIGILIAVIVVGHDAYMTTTGHAEVVASAPLTDEGDRYHRHSHHTPAHNVRQDGTEPASSVPEHCEPVRVAAPANRTGPPSFDTIPVALLPDPAIFMLYASTSRDIVQTPLPHPPDLNRAFYQVYRI